MEFVVSASTGAKKDLRPKLESMQVSLVKGVKEGIKYLHKELESMQVSMEKVSKVPADQVGRHVKLWARDIRKLVCVKPEQETVKEEEAEPGKSVTICSGEVVNSLAVELLEEITGGFSKENKIGSGGYGEVYKGVLNGKEIAVKKLHDHLALDDVIFKNEFENLKRVQHQNIVKLVGYCHETRHINVEHNGRTVCAEMIDRVLCFEYLQNGSLDKHLYEQDRGLDWCTCYKIIKDENMVPKIADFGLSRLFGGTHTHITKNPVGTEMYMPPEYISECKISKKYDVFSLGVIIIQIMTGPKGCSKYSKMSP